MLRDKRVIIILLWEGFVLWLLCSYVIITFVKDGTRADYHTNDFLVDLFRSSISSIPNSGQIVYLTINDKTYQELFKENQFNRKLFAEGLSKLKSYNPEAVIMDLIFAYPSDRSSDSCLITRLKEFQKVYLPVSFSLQTNNLASPISGSKIMNSELNRFLSSPTLLNRGRPYIAGRGMLTAENFLKTASGSGHISDFPDNDGIYRHSILLIKTDSMYLPSLYFSAFLDNINIALNEVKIDWGNRIVIPSLSSSWINHDIDIPIDENGRTRIPFLNIWSEDFPNISFNTFIKLSSDQSQQGMLLDFFEGKFVIVGDVSTGITDIGNTSLNQTSPLISIQANMLNALLTNTFFKSWNPTEIVLLLLGLIALLTLSTLFSDVRIFYSLFIFLPIFLLILVLFQLKNFSLFPVISVLVSFISSFIIMLAQVQYFTQKEKKYAEIENLKKEHEMDEAKKIQLSMLPTVLPQLESIELDTYMSTAAIVGGDYYDFFLDENKNLKFCIADATGHGLKAGTMVTVVKTLFVIIRDEFDINTVLNKMSTIIKKLKLPKLYVCLTLFIYRDYILKFTSAGMPPVLIYRSKEQIVESIILKGMPLGHINNFPYSVSNVQLYPGDIILISSDGLTELFNEQKEMIDSESISLLLKNACNKSPHEIISEFKLLIKNWCGKIEPEDDITIIVIKVR